MCTSNNSRDLKQRSRRSSSSSSSREIDGGLPIEAETIRIDLLQGKMEEAVEIDMSSR